MDKKRKLKGFTLIELMIVLAIFAVILSLVMSFIDPVSKLMKNTSTRERTAAYVDNISEYIDNSLHYSRFMRVYNGDFCNYSEDTRLDSDIVTAEKVAAKLLVEDMLNDAVDKECQPIKGQVRVMKLINTPVDMNADGDVEDTVDLQEGQIYESVYKFTAGALVTKSQEDPSNPGTYIDVPVVNTPAIISSDPTNINKAVINPEHSEEYSYYYNVGYYTLDPLTDAENYSNAAGDSFVAKNREYYTRLFPIGGAHITEGEDFCVNVVSFYKGNKVTGVEYGSDKDITLFKSPSQINSASMALPNLRKCNEIGEVICIRPGRNGDGSLNGSFDPAMLNEPNSDLGSPYREFTPAYTGADVSYITDNIYIVYIMPEEIFDTTIVYK